MHDPKHTAAQFFCTANIKQLQCCLQAIRLGSIAFKARYSGFYPAEIGLAIYFLCLSYKSHLGSSINFVPWKWIANDITPDRKKLLTFLEVLASNIDHHNIWQSSHPGFSFPCYVANGDRRRVRKKTGSRSQYKSSLMLAKRPAPSQGREGEPVRLGNGRSSARGYHRQPPATLLT